MPYPVKLRRGRKGLEPASESLWYIDIGKATLLWVTELPNRRRNQIGAGDEIGAQVRRHLIERLTGSSSAVHRPTGVVFERVVSSVENAALILELLHIVGERIADGGSFGLRV